MEFKQLTLEDKSIVESFTKKAGLWLSDVNFSNLYMWRHSREIGFMINDEHLLIQTRYPQHNPFIFYPLGGNNAQYCIESMRRIYASENLPLEIHSVQPTQLESLKLWFDGEFEVVERRDRFDYIYAVSSLIELSGRKFHSKKNHLNRFYLQYPNVKYESLSSSHIPELIELNNAWFLALEKKDEGLKFENLGINDALNAFEILGLKGGLLRIEGEIVAFSFGEALDEQMALIHIEKANTSFNGVYQAINQALLKNEFSHLTYANREEDLGIEGLRKAKLSYQPEFLLEKYDVRFKT